MLMITCKIWRVNVNNKDNAIVLTGLHLQLSITNRCRLLSLDVLNSFVYLLWFQAISNIMYLKKNISTKVNHSHKLPNSKFDPKLKYAIFVALDYNSMPVFWSQIFPHDKHLKIYIWQNRIIQVLHNCLWWWIGTISDDLLINLLFRKWFSFNLIMNN